MARPAEGVRGRRGGMDPAAGLGGMHTSDDAFLWVRGAALREGRHDLHDLAPTILELLGMAPAVDWAAYFAEYGFFSTDRPERTDGTPLLTGRTLRTSAT